MVTFGSTLRRGLPRIPGGEPWPPDGAAPARNGHGPAVTIVPEVIPVVEPGRNEPVETPQVLAAPGAGGGVVRRGLPRAPGGEPWPQASSVLVAVRTTATPSPTPLAASAAPVAASPAVAQPEMTPPGDATPLRRGLPRASGGEPWPPAGSAPAAPAPAATAADTNGAPAPIAEAPEVPAAGVTPSAAHTRAPATSTGSPLSQPLSLPRTVWAGAHAASRATAQPEPKRIGPFTRAQWAGAVAVGGAGLLFAAAMAVFAVRWLLSTPWGVDFLAAYPGEYHLPAGAPVGFPAWLGWQHFFNVFLMVLIIRSGLQVRAQKKPPAYLTPRRGGAQGKVSLTVWFHQSLDVLWVLNGLVFIVLLFVSGQWVRIVPTAWEVFPNAVSAALQYISLDWPTENGWVNYNALQQLAYFTTVFIAAPLAIATGVRMSGFWPKNAAGLNKAYPIEWARAVHFPTMLYFVAFIAVHVFLVFATGALRNLNHMYAAQGSVDPSAYADNWTGFWFFVASLAVIAVAWVAARPLVLAPIARLFGTVSSR
ncbi:hypothetical protein ASD56_02230 [Microbacterium sp. Root166]|uniref:cytochrome b/b6 domain-containing protein n=1 Tax=Microbacterium sp. Root166 TaxID=1736478 RepID=UPI0006FF4ABD|nr:cytochrome b/b6 domain-containing protein [Microbacterium sp. Root166]KQZ85202.1 hypothetical protein ASD56_02230 [Microbacterium sp. Root166]